MDTSLFVWWLVAGWCGTPWPGRKFPPRPLPHTLITIAIGLIGGLLGGWMFTTVWPAEGGTVAVYVAVSGLPAFAGARILTDILGVTALGPQPIPPGEK